jgi:lysophospholipase L1-like esterase
LEKNYNHLDEVPQVPWSFSYTPDVIVINLGQNDQCGSEPAATMQASYLSFLRMLRGHFPQAQIVALRPFGGAVAEPIRAAVHTAIVAGDTRVEFVDTTGWIERPDTADGIHPNGVGNLKVMGRLVPILRPLLPAE